MSPRIRAEEVVTELDELAANLQWASRSDARSSSNLRLHQLLARPSVLELLERLVVAERARVLSESVEGHP